MTLVPRGSRKPRRRDLAQLAGDRGGVFTASAARSLGISSSALAYHAKAGTIMRLGHGVYRFTDFPISPHEAILAAAATLGVDAVLSHESALKLYGVSDVAPSRLSFTLPRSRRYRAAPAVDVEIHTTSRGFEPGDVVQFDGFRATSLARSIVDSARANAAPEQIVMAVREGLRRNILAERDLDRALRSAPARVRHLVDQGRSHDAG